MSLEPKLQRPLTAQVEVLVKVTNRGSTPLVMLGTKEANGDNGGTVVGTLLL
jgi:hypothetical protein